MAYRIHNIPLTGSFAETLAQKLLVDYKDNLLELPDVLLLLPNRRAVKVMADAFVKVQGMNPTLLPKMIPVGDVEEDELFLSGIDGGKATLDLPPAIDRNERLLLFTKIISAKPQEFGLEKIPLDQACYLAQELANFIDTVNNENLDFAKLSSLVPEEYATHWQETLKFLEIITSFWPDILAERNLIDPGERRNLLLQAQCRQWRENPPQKQIIIAGSTAAFPAMKELVKTVLELPRGEICLSGLDTELEDEAWNEIDETHPQFELKDLLDYLQIKRSDVINLCPPQNPQREILISEIMRPAKTTEKWREIKNKKISVEALGNLSLINCTDIREEALSIALIMRETLEEKERTAALVTSDRNLARRVASELERWNIKVDDSAGKPLSQSLIGTFLRLIAKTCDQDFTRIDLLSLMKHPLAAGGMSHAETRKKIRALEKNVWRKQKSDEELEKFIADIKEKFRNFYELWQNPKANFKTLIREHVKTAEAIAATDEKSGAELLWRGEAGEAAAHFISDLYDKADVLGNIDVREYAGLFDAMMAGITVRPKFGTHPRLKILGPIEARLNRFDITIIGGVNESIWPQSTGSDPWMSRPMKRDFGFPLPEKNIGVSAHDFSELLGCEETILTRSERVQGTPMVKSRWWLRLETVLKAMNIKTEQVEDVIYRLISRRLDEPQSFTKISPPAPKPPVANRPRELPASAIEMWMRDPYAIFAKYILKLKPLEEIEADLSIADYGNIIHAILENFNNRYPEKLPPNAREELLALGNKYFRENGITQETKAFWEPNFLKTVDWIIEKEKNYRPNIKCVHNEVKGHFTINAPAGEFTVTAKADRVDETRNGTINIIDYKTGKARSNKEVTGGYAPQLPIEGLIAQYGGFEGLTSKEVENLIYWQLNKKETVINENMTDILENNLQKISKLVHLFDFPETAYISRPNPKKLPEYSDYEHLARVKEWSVQEDGDD